MMIQRRVRLAFIGLALLLFTQLTQAQRPEQGAKPVAISPNAMASSSHPQVTRAILDVLRDGGNAIDAMLTGMALQHVIEPQMSTLAGGMGGLIYWAKTGELVYLDAELDHTHNAPASFSMARPASVPTTSGQRIGVPGTVAGMAAAAERFGSRPWSSYFDPAIRAATEGFPMYSFLYGEMSAAYERIGAHPASRDKWMPQGFVPPVGDIVRQPILAKTLRRLADEGPGYFRSGDWARRFVDEVNRTGGEISLEELAAYEPRWVAPLEFSYAGIDMRGPPPASTAGILYALLFQILEDFDLPALGHYSDSPESLYLIRQAFEQAVHFAATYTADPRGAEVPTELLLSKDFAQQLAAIIRSSRPELVAAGPASTGAPPIAESGEAGRYEAVMHTDTNHLVIADGDGNWVSMTHTVYGDTFGTGLTVDGVGVNSGNTFPGSGDGKGRRVITPFPALMAVAEDGSPWLAIGSPGLASRAVAISLINRLAYGLPAYESVDAPRFRGYGRYDTLQVESRIDESAVQALESRGVTVKLSAPYNWHMGSVHLVERCDGKFEGVADPRRGGHAEGY
jgi:gamma-glutamyltranspeptidase/glutathione hydrolase